MAGEETIDEKKDSRDSIKKELIQEIRAISKDENLKKRIEEGVFGDAENVKGSILTVMTRAFDNLEKRLETDYAKASQISELKGIARAMETEIRNELTTFRNAMKDLNVRIIETMEKNFENQRRSIDAIPLPLERAIIEIPKSLKAEVQEIRGASEKLGKDLTEVSRLNQELQRSLDDMHKTMKDFSDGMRQFHESLDLQKSRIDEMSQMVQNKMDRMSVAIDEKTIAIAEKAQQSMTKLDTFESTILTFSAEMKSVEGKLSELEKRMVELGTKLGERMTPIEDIIKKTQAESRVRNDDITKKLEMLATTIIGIEALEEFVKSIEKKIEGTKVDLTGIESGIEEIKMKTDFSAIEKSVKKLHEKIDEQAESRLAAPSAELPEVKTMVITSLEKSIDELKDEIQKMSEKHSKSIKDIQVRINILQRTIEMKD